RSSSSSSKRRRTDARVRVGRARPTRLRPIGSGSVSNLNSSGGNVVCLRRPRRAGMSRRGVKRGVIVAKMKPGSEEAVAAIFAESDESDLPALAGVRHRSLFALEDVYIHYVELDEDFAESVDQVRDHP